MDNKEEQRRYYDVNESIITNEIETRTPNEVADDNFNKAIKGIENFQEELYREVLSARGVNPEEVNVESLINGETTIDEIVEKYKSKQ